MGNAKVGRVLRIAGSYVLNLAAAVFGPAVIESPIWSALGHSRSAAEMEVRALLFSLTIAALLGFFICKYWSNASAPWVWISPMLFFVLGVVAYAGRGNNSVLVSDGFWKHFFARTALAGQVVATSLYSRYPLLARSHIPWRHGFRCAFDPNG